MKVLLRKTTKMQRCYFKLDCHLSLIGILFNIERVQIATL